MNCAELAVNADQRPEPNRRRLSKGACLVNYRPAEHLCYRDTTSTLGLSLGYATLTQPTSTEHLRYLDTAPTSTMGLFSGRASE